MGRIGLNIGLTKIMVLLVIVGTVYSCANKGYPEGGPKDETPPKVIGENPASFVTNFDKKSVSIYFDEYVQIPNISEKFIISPPLKKKPKVRLRGKYILVELADTLKPGTTYSLDFADGIVDYNEANPLGYYRYVFSTGNYIDTLELSGNIVEAESYEPAINKYVFLYSDLNDSTPLKQIPDYIARTDSSGFFRVTNIKDQPYRVVAIEDNNRDYKYTPEAEPIGFLNKEVQPVVFNMTRTDTITPDSIVTRTYAAYGPNNLILRLFQEEPTQLYLVDGDRKEREKLTFAFSIPGINEFKIRSLDTLPLDNWYLPERTLGNDTLNLWIKDSVVYKKDTLNFVLSYLRSDSVGMRTTNFDTVKYVFTTKKREEKNNRKKKEDEKPPIEFLKMTSSTGTTQDVNTDIVLEFDKPILEEGLANIQLFEKVDTIYTPVEYELIQDSLKIRQFRIRVKWKPEQNYRLRIDSASVHTIYGLHNNKIENNFKVKALEEYGSLKVNMKGVQGQVIVELYKSEATMAKDKKTYDVVARKMINGDANVMFELLNEGKYRIRAIKDGNGNGKWDTGLYLKQVQPEEIVYLPGEVNVRQNFDIEWEFDMEKTYTKETEEPGK